MGYLVKSSFPAFSKAVASFWFRVPGEVFSIMDGIGDPPPYPDSSGFDIGGGLYRPSLFKNVPFMTFGQPQTDIDNLSVQPSFIGLEFNLGSSLATLACNMQTPLDGVLNSSSPGAATGRPGVFYVCGSESPEDVRITPDVWHHGLISFDISGSCSVLIADGEFNYSSTCSFSWALDDVGKPNATLGPSGNFFDDGLPAGKIVSNWQLQGPSDDGDSSSFSGGFIPSGDFYLPCGGDLSDRVRQIEMAKVQVFTGVTMNTGIQANRRAFITADHRPAAPSAGATLLGKSPAIHFNTKDDWINGRNRGTGGNFTKTGTIVPYVGTVGL